MLTGLLFLGSCQELEQVEPLVEESLDASFDRAKFLSAVNLATNKNIAEINQNYHHLYFRNINDYDVRTVNFINDIAVNINTIETYYYAYLIEQKNEFWLNQLENEVEVDFNNLDAHVKKHYDDFLNKIDVIALDYENGNYTTENELVNKIKQELTNKHQEISSDLTISAEDRLFYSNNFEMMELMTDDFISILKAESQLNGFINSNRWLRGLIRIVVVAVVFTAIVYTAGLTIKGMKMGSIIQGHKTGWALATKGGKITKNFKIYAGWKVGLGKGFYEAAKNFDKEWKGFTEESKYGVKISF